MSAAREYSRTADFFGRKACIIILSMKAKNDDHILYEYKIGRPHWGQTGATGGRQQRGTMAARKRIAIEPQCCRAQARGWAGDKITRGATLI